MDVEIRTMVLPELRAKVALFCLAHNIRAAGVQATYSQEPVITTLLDAVPGHYLLCPANPSPGLLGVLYSELGVVYSAAIWTFCVRTHDAKIIADKMILFFSYFVILKSILTDQGTEFTSNLLKEIAKMFKIKKNVFYNIPTSNK